MTDAGLTGVLKIPFWRRQRVGELYKTGKIIQTGGRTLTLHRHNPTHPDKEAALLSCRQLARHPGLTRTTTPGLRVLFYCGLSKLGKTDQKGTTL
jgi:hypothetical protein